VSDSELYRFTQEEWAEQPYTIELRGGRLDGERFTLPNLPHQWHVPEPVGVLSFETEPDPLMAAVPSFPVTDYRRTDQVTDDGAHIYERVHDHR
jgi:hypothetical protein